MWIEWDEIGARYGGSLTWDPVRRIRRMSAAEVVDAAQREALWTHTRLGTVP
jgi:hypothetical protein